MPAIALAHAPKISVADYILGEQLSQIRHEYVAGEVYAMAGASERHNLVSLNIAAALHGHLRGKRCKAFINDMKVRIWANHDIFYYPDVMVACEPTDSDAYWKSKPRVIIEVLSQSTRRTDEQEKLLTYLRIDSLEEYVLVEQETMQLTLFRRANNWEREEAFGPEAVLKLASLDFAMPLTQIYEGVLE